MEKKWIYFALIALCVALSGTLFTSCSADEAEENDGVYRYTAEQIQEIENLKEDYGVENVNIPYESTSQPLLSLSEVEEVLQIVAAFQSSAKNCVERGENTCTFSTRDKMLTRTPTLGGETYSGDYSGHEAYTSDHGDVAYIDYTITWKNISSSSYSDVTVDINSITIYEDKYSIIYNQRSVSYQGGCHLVVTLYFDVYVGSLISSFSFKVRCF